MRQRKSKTDVSRPDSLLPRDSEQIRSNVKNKDLTPFLGLSVRHGHITKRGPVELRTAFVQVVMGMLRYRKLTGRYRIMTRYQDMKKHKGAGKSIIATARKISTITYAMLKSRKPFDPTEMGHVRKKDCPVTFDRPLALAG